MQSALGRRVANGRTGWPGEAGGERLGATVTNSILGVGREGGSQEEPGGTNHQGLDGQPGKELDSAMPRDQFPGTVALFGPIFRNCSSSIRAVINVHKEHSRM